MFKINVISNFIARFWSVFISIFLLPYYIKYLGIEAYGLIGSFTTVASLISLLDFGMSTAANREMARMSVLPEEKHEIKNFAKTLEVIYWVTGCAVVVIFLILSQIFPQHWFHNTELSTQSITRAYVYMGIAMAAMWPFAFYSGALLGLQKQFVHNIIIVIFNTARSVGALWILIYVSPTIEVFFIWQAGVNLLQTLVSRIILWKNLPVDVLSARFKWDILKKIWRFTTSMSAISVTIIILMNVDKAVLSKILPLSEFGYYSIAIVIASGLNHFTGPIFSAVFPRMTQSVALKNEDELKRLYHFSSQLIACLVLPVALCLIFCSREIMNVWGMNQETIVHVARIVPVVVMGTMINCLLSMSYGLQLSYGWTRLALIQNIIAIIIIIPPMIWASYRFGAVGAAWLWFLLNLGYILITIPVMHRRILKTEMKRWYLFSCLIPFVVTAAVVMLGSLLFNNQMTRLQNFIALGAIYTSASLSCIFACSEVRKKVVDRFILLWRPG